MIDRTNGTICEYKSLILHVDGGCEPKNPGGTATSGWVLYDANKPKAPIVENGQVVKDGGPLATNNFGEYNALYLALKWLCDQNWRGILAVKADSKLLIEQVQGNWKCNAAHLAEIRTKIWNCIENLGLQIITEDIPLPDESKKPVAFFWIPRDKNSYANDLCREAFQEYKRKK